MPLLRLSEPWHELVRQLCATVTLGVLTKRQVCMGKAMTQT